MIDPRSRRATLVIPALLAGLSMLGPFSTDTPLPAFASMRAEFGVGSDRLQLIISAYLFAFGAMAIFHGPLSDALGRKPVMVWGVAAYGLASVVAAIAPTLTVLLICRVLQGLCAGGGVIVSRTVIRDLYTGPQAQRLMSRVAMIFGIAPVVAPLAGGALLQVWSWRSIFWTQAALAVILTVAVRLVLPETHPPARRTPLAARSVVRSVVAVFGDAAYERMAWGGGLMQASWFVYVGGAAIVVGDLLGRGELDYWMLFGPLVLGMTVGSWVSGRAAGRVGGRALVSAGFGVALIGALVNVALAALADRDHTVWYAVTGPTLMTLGAATAFPTIQLALLDCFPSRRGAAASGSTFLGLTISAVVTAVVVPVASGSLRQVALAALALMLVSGLLWAWHLIAVRRELRTPTEAAGGDPAAYDPRV